MRVDLSYLGRSRVSQAADGLELTLSPNLARGKVFFDGAVENPIRYREAMSALHDVVVSDLRFKKRSGSEAYKEWLKQQRATEDSLRKQVFEETKKKELDQGPGSPPPNLDKRFREMHSKYWKARNEWAIELSQTDPELWRALVPCDPVITVAPDVVFFEGFAKDESSYGCLMVDRNAFAGGSMEGLGTTNVDYSMALYQSIQTLRTYRPTRLTVDPSGFEVKVEGRDDYREEKIDLPPSWLRGFGQITAAMMLPSRTVRLDVAAVYSLLAYLKRHREKKGPRSLAFDLVPGKPAKVTIEPWGLSVTASVPYDGPQPETIKVWGRRRLMALARVLPLAEHIDVRLLGTGLPSLWVANLHEMRFILGLSGWTANDWTSSAALDLLAGLETPDPLVAAKVNEHLASVRRARTDELVNKLQLDKGKVLAALHLLAKQGQSIYDFANDVHRYRPILPVALSDELIGPEHPELRAAKDYLAKKGGARIRRDEVVGNLRIVVGDVGEKEGVEVAVDVDGLIKNGRCDCSYFFTSRLRKGPCRHLLVLRMTITAGLEPGQSVKPKRWWN